MIPFIIAIPTAIICVISVLRTLRLAYIAGTDEIDGDAFVGSLGAALNIFLALRAGAGLAGSEDGSLGGAPVTVFCLAWTAFFLLQGVTVLAFPHGFVARYGGNRLYAAGNRAVTILAHVSVGSFLSAGLVAWSASRSWQAGLGQIGWEFLDAIPVLKVPEAFDISEPLSGKSLVDSGPWLLLFRLIVLVIATIAIKDWLRATSFFRVDVGIASESEMPRSSERGRQ
jgi:hypothetical protein